MTSVDVYVRVSRVGGRENLISPDEQERRARALADERGLHVGKVLVDLDESGGKWDRPGLQEALERVRARQSRGLIVAWLDRLSRDSEHAHRLVREITEAGGAVYAPDAPADWTSPEGELQAGLMFAFAQYVRKRAAAGFERSAARAIAEGVPVSSNAPIGYRKRADRRLEPDPATAPVVRRIFEMSAEGRRLGEIVDYAAEQGLRTSYGAVVTTQVVSYIVGSRVYLGEISYGRDRRHVNTEAHEPIVDLATWTAAQRPTRRKYRPRSVYLLSGLVRCQACGYAMSPEANDRVGMVRYRCKRRHGGGICPNPAIVQMHVLDGIVERRFLSWEHETLEAEADTTDLGGLRLTLARAEQRLAQALSPEVQDAAGESWGELVRDRRRERDEAALAVGNAEASERRVPTSRSDIARRWPGMSISQRREALSAEISDVVVRRVGRGEVGVWMRSHSDPALPRPAGALVPVDDPPEDSWVFTLEDDREPLGDAA